MRGSCWPISRRIAAGAIVVVLAGGCALVPRATSRGPAPVRTIGVFRGSIETSRVDAFGLWTGRNITYALTFPAEDSWAQLKGPDWLLDPWTKWVRAQSGRRLVLSVPMLPGGWADDATVARELSEGAAGAYDVHFRRLAQRLVAKGLGKTILRVGWEFNGGWYRWRAKPNKAAWRAYFRKIVTTMRSVPGSNFKIDWSIAIPNETYSALEVYPGDKYVDIVGLDVYDKSWMSGTYPYPPGASEREKQARRNKVWREQIVGGGWLKEGLTFWRTFADAHKKQISVPEWGVVDYVYGGVQRGGLDNPSFVTRMGNWIAENRVAYQVYFEFDSKGGGGDHRISNSGTKFPRAARAYRERFGRAS